MTSYPIWCWEQVFTQTSNLNILEASKPTIRWSLALFSVEGAVISKKYVVVAKVKHSQRMNDPLVSIWIISDNDGSIVSLIALAV